MSGLLLVLRPEPGATATAEKVRRLGLDVVAAPLFTVRPIPWEAPDPLAFDALLLTSANAARLAGPQIARFAHLPCYAVGEATGDAAEALGFYDLRIGPSDGNAVLAQIPPGHRILHLSGRDHVGLARERLERRVVYAADLVEALPAAAREALALGALVLIHSPRAGALFAELVDRAGIERDAISAAAISEAAARALGDGWRHVAAAERPRDEALLELAARLCQGEARVRE